MRRFFFACLLLGIAQAHAQTNLAPNPGFEEPGGWELITLAGAEGSVAPDGLARSGAQSLKLTKANAAGYLVLRSQSPVKLQPKVRYTCRLRYHATEASLANLLLLRVAPKDTHLGYNSIDRSAGWMSQSLLINSAGGKWETRVVHYETPEPQEVYLHILLWGNPCAVRLDDLELTSEPSRVTPIRNEFADATTAEALPGLLAARPEAQAQVAVRDGRSVLLANGQETTPVLYKAEPYKQDGDYRGFGEAGVDLCTVGVRLGAVRGQEGVWTGKGRYDFAVAEAALQRALLRNPQAHVILDLWFYPYPAWGAEHPEECWTDATGRKAYGGWGNLQGFTDDLASLPAGRFEYWWYPSYNSQKWREEASEAAAALLAHLRQTPYSRAIVGYFITGGHDGQFQVFGPPDYSAATARLFRQWLRDKYGTPQRLKEAWGAAPASFEAVAVPAPAEPAVGSEGSSPYLTAGPQLDYREFALWQAWRLRDEFARVVKAAAGKPVLTIAYGNPPNYDFSHFLNQPHLDACGSMSYYPYRNPGYAAGYRPPDSFALHGKLFFQELDTRSWVGTRYADEVYQEWIGAGLEARDWRAINRKLVGVSLAGGLGFWYYDMGHYFDAPEILAEIRQTVRQAGRLRKGPASGFRPEVCVVQVSGRGQHFTSSQPALKHSEFYQTMALEQSGVPFDLHYLPDVLARPQLQDYRVYVFLQAPYLSAEQRRQIKLRLLNGGRTIIWMHDAGYLGEQGKSAEGMSELVGMTVRTEEVHARQTPLLTAPALLRAGVRPMLGLNEMLLTLLLPAGEGGFAAREQPFWIEDETAVPLAIYRENGRVAGGLKMLPGWTSVYLAGGNSLTGDLFNYLACEAKVYTCGPAGQAINMNGKFVSLHGLRSGRYAFRLPPGATTMREAESGRALSVKNGVCDLEVTAQETYWFELQ